MLEQGIKHTSFDKGRFVFEDYNEGNTQVNELQFPFIDPTLNLHLKYSELAQSEIANTASIYDEYKESVRTEFDYLRDTKVLGGESKKVPPLIEEKENMLTNETSTVQTNTEIKLTTDDFDFDSLLTDEESSKDEFAEIDDIDNNAMELLKELKGEN
ncbi:MAG: hypothetical protein J0647_07380, partial [Campylobacteraceae bacterium]|nr:hypothetical protein [Campylobacteraceae bacterium]